MAGEFVPDTSLPRGYAICGLPGGRQARRFIFLTDLHAVCKNADLSRKIYFEAI
jgi:hypothetical protein